MTEQEKIRALAEGVMGLHFVPFDDWDLKRGLFEDEFTVAPVSLTLVIGDAENRGPIEWNPLKNISDAMMLTGQFVEWHMEGRDGKCGCLLFWGDDEDDGAGGSGATPQEAICNAALATLEVKA